MSNVAAILALVDLIRGMLGKKPKAQKVREALGENGELVEAYLSGCEKLQAAADAGTELGPLTAIEVEAIAKGDDLMVKAAKKLQRLLEK